MKFGKITKPIKRTLLALRWPLLLIVLAALLFEWVVSTVGYPGFVCALISDKIVDAPATCIINEMRGEPFTTLTFNGVDYELVLDTCGRIEANVPKVDLGLRRRNLLHFKAMPRMLELSGASVRYFRPGSKSPDIALDNIQCTAEHSLNDVLRGTLRASFLKTALMVHFELQNGSLLYNSRNDNTLDTKAIGTFLNRIADELSRRLDGLSVGLNDAILIADIRGDLARPEGIQVKGDATFQDCVFKGTSIPKLRWAFSYGNRKLRLYDVQCLLSTEEVVTANAWLDLKTKTCRATVAGEIYPLSLLTLAGLDDINFKGFIIMSLPITIAADIPEFSLNDIKSISPTVSFSNKNLLLEGVAISEINGEVAYHDGKISINELLLRTSSPAPSILKGDAEYDIKAETIDAKLSGDVNIPNIVAQLGYGNDGMLSQMMSSGHLEMHLQNSPALEWRKWNADLTFNLEELRTGKLKWTDINLTAGMHNGCLDLKQLSLQLAGDTGNRFHLQGSTDIASWMETLKQRSGAAVSTAAAEAKSELALQVTKDDKTGLDATMQLALCYDSDGLALRIDGGHADVRPEILHSIFEGPTGLAYDEFPLAWERCLGDSPLSADFTMPPWNLSADLNSLSINGSFIGSEVELLEVPLAHVESDFACGVNSVTFTNVHGLIAYDDTDIHFSSLDIQFEPLGLEFLDMTVDGVPEPIEPWLYDDDAREIYRKIWEHCIWSAKTPPHFEIPILQYHSLAHSNYEVILIGKFDSTGARYREFQTSKAACSLEMTLPSPGIKLTDISICANADDALTGEAHISFGNGITGRFELNFPQGEMDIDDLIRNATGTNGRYLAALQLHPQTHLSCTGYFNYNSKLIYGLNGKISTPLLKYRNLSFSDVNGDWSADNNSLLWNIPSARFYDGQLATTGNFDFRTESGECIAAVRKIPLYALNTIFLSKEDEMAEAEGVDASKTNSDKDKAAPINGYAGCDARFSFYRNWTGRPLQLQGSARLEVQEADLWHVPLLSSLGRLLPFSNELGRITKLDADILLQGQRVNFTNIVTDGTLISLRGKGNYYLDTNLMRFAISGEFIHSNRFLNWLLSPVAWMVNAELSGTPKDFTWHTTTMRKIFANPADYNPNKLSTELYDATNQGTKQ